MMKFTESIYGFAALTFEKKLRATKNTCFFVARNFMSKGHCR